MALVVDTGPLYAAYDRRDNDHTACRALFESTHEELVLPAPVVVEFDQLTASRRVPNAAEILLHDILDGAFSVVSLTFDDYARCLGLVEQYADSDIGFVDAAVLAIVERLEEPKLATLDRRHFGLLRPRHIESLRLLPDNW